MDTQVFTFNIDQERMRGRLSNRTAYRLFVDGDFGPQEIGNFIKLLETQKAILLEDEASLFND